MKVLFLCDPRPHAHDYGVDFLIQGAYSVLGASNVIEYPEKPNLHIDQQEGRDACQIDSDAWLPAKNIPRSEFAHAATRVDVVFLTSANAEMPRVWSETCANLPASTPVVALQFSDEWRSQRDQFEAICGRKAIHFQREVPEGSFSSLWLSQPRSRIRPVSQKPAWANRVFYRGTGHNWGEGGTRQRMIKSVQHATLPHQCSLALMGATQELHVAPEVYRERLWESSVSLVWNSHKAVDFPVWQSNRFAESIALGCAVVAERPFYTTELGDIPGVTWIDEPEDAGQAVQRLLGDPDAARAMAAASQSYFERHLSSEALLAHIVAIAKG